MTIHKIISWTVVIVWMILIFSFSSQAAYQSDKLSTGITEVIVKTIEKIIPYVDIDIRGFNHIVRKAAHFFVYLVLGVLVINALRISGKQGYKSVAVALLICVLYAISDEVHQIFVPGRCGQIKDVIIDSAGAGLGIGLYMFFDKEFVNLSMRF